MKTFKEWLVENHSETLEEGWMKNLAVSGALLGAGMGINQSFLQDKESTNKPMNAWQAKKAEIANQKADLQRKTQGLKSGQSRTFIQGKATNGYDSEGSGDSWTNPNAKDYLNNQELEQPGYKYTSPNAKDYLNR